MAEDNNLNETRQLLLQAMQRMEAISGQTLSSERSAPYPYRPITRQVNIRDVGNRRRLCLSLNKDVQNRPRTQGQDPVQGEQPGPSPLAGRFQASPDQRRIQSAREERRHLFQPSALGKRPKAKKPRRLQLWKKMFVCLSSVSHNCVPGSVEKAGLLNSGLGSKHITLYEHGSSWELHEELVKAFPKLEGAGGYELLRTEEGNSRDLIVIPQPNEGYTASYSESSRSTC